MSPTLSRFMNRSANDVLLAVHVTTVHYHASVGWEAGSNPSCEAYHNVPFSYDIQQQDEIYCAREWNYRDIVHFLFIRALTARHWKGGALVVALKRLTPSLDRKSGLILVLHLTAYYVTFVLCVFIAGISSYYYCSFRCCKCCVRL